MQQFLKHFMDTFLVAINRNVTDKARDVEILDKPSKPRVGIRHTGKTLVRRDFGNEFGDNLILIGTILKVQDGVDDGFWIVDMFGKSPVHHAHRGEGPLSLQTFLLLLSFP